MTLVTRPMTITLWDFSWYARTGDGDVYENLEGRCAEAVERGYDTLRICAMPFLLFGSGLDTTSMRFSPLENRAGRGTRWYDMDRSSQINAREHMLRLARACDRQGLRLILSSWEYQQSSSLAEDRSWMDQLMAVPPEDRAVRLAECLADLHDFLGAHRLGHVIALTELHNEVQIGHLTDGLRVGEAEGVSLARAEPLTTIKLLRNRLEAGLARFSERRPEDAVTVNYAGVPVGALSDLPDGMDALVLHPYLYGVLGELMRTYGLGQGNDELDEEGLRRDLLRPDAPPFSEAWPAKSGDAWRTGATIIPPALLHAHDWSDPEAFDAWG